MDKAIGKVSEREPKRKARKRRLSEVCAQMGQAGNNAEQRRHRNVDKYQAARHQLSLASLPVNIPCRDQEKDCIRTFVSNALSKDAMTGDSTSGSALYVYGIPGTGKTATVLEVMAFDSNGICLH